MPELPEVEIVARALRPALTGRTIVGVEIFTPKMREPLAPLTQSALPGRRITGVRRRGRYFIIDLDDGRMLLGHLGMSGVVRIESAAVERRKHEHLFLALDDGMIFRFECTRRFSIFKVCPAGTGQWPEELAALGPEPLSDDFTPERLFELSRKRRTPVKVFVMDNAVVTGVGNIYATEALFAAGISPLRPAEKLTRRECARLHETVRRVLAESIEVGGSSIHDYRHVDGTEGQFALQLQVYGRENAPCPVCGTPIRRVILGGRSSCYCPKCQK